MKTKATYLLGTISVLLFGIGLGFKLFHSPNSISPAPIEAQAETPPPQIEGAVEAVFVDPVEVEAKTYRKNMASWFKSAKQVAQKAKFQEAMEVAINAENASTMSKYDQTSIRGMGRLEEDHGFWIIPMSAKEASNGGVTGIQDFYFAPKQIRYFPKQDFLFAVYDLTCTDDWKGIMFLSQCHIKQKASGRDPDAYTVAVKESFVFTHTLLERLTTSHGKQEKFLKALEHSTTYLASLLKESKTRPGRYYIRIPTKQSEWISDVFGEPKSNTEREFRHVVFETLVNFQVLRMSGLRQLEAEILNLPQMTGESQTAQTSNE